MTQAEGDRIEAHFTGDVTGQVAVGKHISQTRTSGGSASLSDDEWAQLAELFEALKARVLTEAPEGQAAPAAERIEELEEALTADEPDLTTVEYVKRWFLRKLPGLAGVVTGVLVDPIVGKLVQSAGDAALAQLTRVAEE